MGTAILVGIPRNYIDSVKNAASKLEADLGFWSIKFVPAPRDDIEIIQKMVGQTLELAAQHESSHILGFSTKKDRQGIADQLRNYFRFRWFRHELIRFLKSPDPGPFVQCLTVVLREELDWAARVKPSSLSSPLLLPECSFSADRRCNALWRNALAFGDKQNIDGAEKTIHEFRSVHFRKVEHADFRAYQWIDKDDRIFDKDGERHGDAPFPRQWKFSYRIEEGFHYDVKHLDGKQFFLMDAFGNRKTAKQGDRINLDPHGYIR